VKLFGKYTVRTRKSIVQKRILERDNYICQYCGDTAIEVDHITPVAIYDDNSDDNLVASCLKCNRVARSKLFENFVVKRRFILQRRFPVKIKTEEEKWLKELQQERFELEEEVKKQKEEINNLLRILILVMYQKFNEWQKGSKNWLTL